MTEIEPEWTVKFKISDEMHYVNIEAETSDDALLIFQQWLFGPEGEQEDLPGKDWRALNISGARKVFKNEWVSSFHVLTKNFMIRG